MEYKQDFDALLARVSHRNQNLEALIDRVADLIYEARRVVVFTGAGVSTESGIPDFRSPGGVWTRENPDDWTFQRFLSDPETRKRSWKRWRGNRRIDAQPNPAHYAIAELEKLGKLDCVITQNVDGLHQKAGNSGTRVLELHGSARYVLCLQCAKRFPREEIEGWLDSGVEIPLCNECGGLLKSATISFGQAMPERETAEAGYRSRNCDLFIVVGSSLVVYPAAYMPIYALESGAKLVLINLMETPLDDSAHIRIWGKAGDILPKIVERLKERMGLEQAHTTRGEA